ncbi:putative late blight resistance protein homolog R1B-17 isoform X1 [Rhododendron vialii]|uniref:putative late blight resistance protein homolog R1B-17 isoform X1 n=1 Tax=Rhododendron vialii TaxID=182163 RepID=UPI00265E4A83|nr:putative late blight resistance protein homolog R1B-17 isoform X1 [Rhododendron vialii]XP_058193914.1 putative late blight resistance protein homolog R1B-17 isoform X1 [Rhododendron vialii]XP_058193915.1 putative late blight resistance protein homolog R1B-17 isoform X1 [Rhododendron vialii]XP_058193916.1 putative late blight resistance protein homolog R1B-17 isoform X1 [Rhododendron vialii]
MGDTAVDFFLGTLKNLIMSSDLDVIIDEKHQLQSLAEEIKYLRGFLQITEKKRKEHSEVMNLVMRIRDVVSEAENIVELFVVLVFKANHASDSLLEHQDHLSLDLESVKKEIKTLKAKVKQILDENMYDINGVAVKKLKHSSTGSGGGSGSTIGSNTSIVVEKKAVVGFKEEVETLMGKLHDIGEGGRLEIISIIGAGGGGKTTLAREVYDHPLTLQKFEIRAWVNVSQDYDKTMKRHLLIRILESAFPKKNEDYKEISDDKLGEKVYKCLQNRKYLIVMDDVWGIEAWNDIQRSFPRECKGSKVVFTSRLPVQSDSICCVPHCMDPLTKSCSWELLEKKVFGMKRCPPELVDIGKQIAEKCKGLPLAIVTIAGILATEDKTLDVWEEVAKHLSSTIAKNQEGCMEILELSYNHLPLHLQACFLYIGAHPEDYEMPSRELIWLWIAEGFIQQSDGGKSLEAIAEDYLIGLIDRSLVTVARNSKSDGGIKACHIHDLLRELCLKKVEEDNFFVKIYEGDYFSPSTTNKHRRLFIGRQFFDKFPPRPLARNLRSFLYLSSPNSSLKQNLSFFVENFELLRVLHLISATSLGEIGIGDLVHLRYLALTLREEHNRALNSFHFLWNLEILILQVPNYDKNISLPRHIVKMVKLRHLYTKSGIFEYHHVSDDEEEGNMLDSLQTLHRMCACEHCLHFLEMTPNLRKLGLYGGDVDFEGDDVLMLCDLEFLKCLETLSVAALFDYKRMASIGLKLPPTLTRLSLSSTFLEWEKLSIILQTLPSLEVLKLLDDACRGPVWDTSELEEGFSQLKYLRLEYLDIEEWIASEDEFPRLEVLAIQICDKLKGIPIDFANLNELREIKVQQCTRSAEESAKEIQEKQRNTKGDDDCVNLVLKYNPING